jgi:tetratricopeptide (TPR) repeat protein
LAAQEQNKVCTKCFEVNDPAATFCIECGAPLSDDPTAEGSDQEVYREITQANLHRIRGGYKEAIDVCLGILKRFPNNGTAHTLLGDIYAEKGELEQAAEWFEMALDLRPESVNDRRKLESVQKRMSEQEAATTAQQLGIPESKPKTQQYVFVMFILVAIVGIGAFLVGRATNNAAANGAPSLVNQTIDVGATQEPKTEPQQPVEETPDEPLNPPTVTVWNGTPQDQAITSLLSSKYTVGRKLLAVREDPRGPSLLVIGQFATGDDAAATAVEFARAVFVEYPTYVAMTVQLTDGQQRLFIADVARADYQRVIDESLDPKAMLTRVWPPAPIE